MRRRQIRYVDEVADAGAIRRFVVGPKDLELWSQDDGRLEVHEILSLRLKAKLVTLSACDTALGSGYFAEVPAGDDLVGRAA